MDDFPKMMDKEELMNEPVSDAKLELARQLYSC